METSAKELPFLDILIKRNNDIIWMDIYFKPTDTCQCLPFSPSYPNHYKKNVPFTLAQRICTIVENKQQKLRHLLELKENFKKKYDYPISIKINGIKKALEIPQNELRKAKKKT